MKRPAKKAKAVEIEPARERSGFSILPANNVFSDSRALFLIIATTVLVYANSLSGAFVFDDTQQIVENPALRGWSNIFSAFTSDVWSFQRGSLSSGNPLPYYRPLFTAYLTLNYQIFGLWEPGWHLANLSVHVTATVLVYYLLKRLSGDPLLSLLAALIFGLHPAHVESISWISGIPDPLAALFYIPSLIWYVSFRQGGDRRWLIASIVGYGLSVLCKETPLVLPLIFIVWEFTQLRGKRSLRAGLAQALPHLVPYAVVAGGYLALRFAVLGRLSWRHPFTAQVPDYAVWMTVPFVTVNYLKHLIAPFYLSLIYGASFITSVVDPRFLFSVGLLLGLGYVIWRYRKKLPAQVSVAIALTLAPLLPVLNLRVFHHEYIIQDRYLYLPSIGFCYLVAVCIAQLARNRRFFAAAISALIILSFGVGTVLQNRIWHNSVALWQRAVNYSPNSRSTHYNLGLAYLGFKQYDAALAELLEAKRLDPEKAAVYNNLALAEAGLGKVDDAVADLATALRFDPRLLEAHNNLGALLYDKSDYEGSKREFSLVLEQNPSFSSVRFNLARTMAAMRDHSGAIREYEAVLAQDPNDVAARYQLALSYAAVGRKENAVAEFGRALVVDRDAGRVAEMRKKLEQIQSQ
ncbi:MAG: tetratricopeptide repeat protein [bacterium]